MRAFICPECKRTMVPKHNRSCEYQKTKHGVISGCGFRVAYNKTWRFCPICGLPICKMGWIGDENG